MTILDSFIKIFKTLKLAADLVMKTKLMFLVLIVEILNAILELNWKRLYFVMKEKKMERRKKGEGLVERNFVTFP